MELTLTMALESTQVATRMLVASLIVSGSLIGGLAMDETYVGEAMIPVPGDKWTYGYGTTTGVKKGDRITPERALIRLLDEVENVYAAGIKKCITAPLYQREYDAYLSLAYNIGVPAFCKKANKEKLDKYGNPDPEPDRLIDLINSEQYAAACARIDAFNKFRGQVLKGLVIRRAKERKICEGRE